MWTEKMNEILTSPAARRIVPQLSPVYGNAYVALWLFNVVGKEIDNMEQRSDELQMQEFAQTVTWAISYWEEGSGIVPDETMPLDQRRQRLISKMQLRLSATPYRIANLAYAVCGAKARVSERTSKNTFTVFISSIPNKSVTQDVRNAIEKIKPANLLFDVQYEQGTEAKIYVGGIVSMAKHIIIKQV